MDPVRQRGKDAVRDQCAKDTKNHDVGDVLEESLATHVIARGKHNWWDAEIKEHVVVEDDVFLDDITVALKSSETNQES